jgi:hypothetical protein
MKKKNRYVTHARAFPLPFRNMTCKAGCGSCADVFICFPACK